MWKQEDVEAKRSMIARRVGPTGRVIGVDRFGESAPAAELFEHYGFTIDNVVAAAKEVLN